MACVNRPQMASAKISFRVSPPPPVSVFCPPAGAADDPPEGFLLLMLFLLLIDLDAAALKLLFC